MTGAEVADLNEDVSPEIYVYATSADSGFHVSLIGYGASKISCKINCMLTDFQTKPC